MREIRKGLLIVPRFVYRFSEIDSLGLGTELTKKTVPK